MSKNILLAGILGGLALFAWERSRRRSVVVATAPPSAAAPAAPGSPAPATAATAAEQRALLDRLGIRGSGEAE